MVLTGGQSGTLRRGLRDAFDNAYETEAERTKELLEPVMALGLPSDTDQEFYSYFKDAPFPRYWPRGQEVIKAGFEAVQFSLINRDFGIEIEWHGNDEDDNQNTTAIRTRAADSGRNFAFNPTDAFFDLLLGTTTFLPATGNAPDGAAVFATTDGAGNARFGATNGNLLTSTGNNSFSSSIVLRADLWRAIEQFHLFQNTQSKPLFPKQVHDQGYILYYGAANQDVFAEAFLANPAAVTYGTAGTDLAATSPENSLAAAGISIEGRAVQQITDNDAFLFLKGSPFKPFFQQLRQPPTEQPFDEGNSKSSARSKLRSMIWHERAAYAPFLPYGVIKLNGT
jgi:hypothetical protein